MQKVTSSGQHHRETEFIAGLDRIGITETATGMNNGCDAMAGGKSHGVVEREEPVTCQHGTLGLISRCLKSQAG